MRKEGGVREPGGGGQGGSGVIKGNGVGKNNNVVNLQEPTDPQPSRYNTYRRNPKSINSSISVSIFNSASCF